MRIKIEAVTPKRKVADWGILEGYLTLAMTGPCRTLLMKEFDLRSNKWDHRVTFRATFEAQVTQLKLTVEPFGRNKRYWVWVSAGTNRDGKTTEVKRAQYLTLPEKYVPHTAPGTYYSGPGARVGPYSYFKSVPASSIKARRFERDIVRMNKDKLIQFIEEAVAKAARG